MNEITLKTDTNTLVLKGEDGVAKEYRPLAGSALDLYDTLKGMATTAPDQIIGTLEAAARLVAPPNPTGDRPAEPGAMEPKTPEGEFGESSDRHPAEEEIEEFTSAGIPFVASRSTNPYSDEEDELTNQPKKVSYVKGGQFPLESSEQEYADWEASLGDGVAQINKQEVDGVTVVTAHDAQGSVIGNFVAGRDGTGLPISSEEDSAYPGERTGAMTNEEIDALAASTINSLSKSLTDIK